MAGWAPTPLQISAVVQSEVMAIPSHSEPQHIMVCKKSTSGNLTPMFFSFCQSKWSLNNTGLLWSPLQCSCPYSVEKTEWDEDRILLSLTNWKPSQRWPLSQLHCGIDGKRKFSWTPQEWHPGDGACGTSLQVSVLPSPLSKPSCQEPKIKL